MTAPQVGEVWEHRTSQVQVRIDKVQAARVYMTSMGRPTRQACIMDHPEFHQGNQNPVPQPQACIMDRATFQHYMRRVNSL